MPLTFAPGQRCSQKGVPRKHPWNWPPSIFLQTESLASGRRFHMLVSEESLEAVDQHWAVLAVDEEKRERALEVAKAKLVRTAVGQQMKLAFKDQANDDNSLERVA